MERKRYYEPWFDAGAATQPGPGGKQPGAVVVQSGATVVHVGGGAAVNTTTQRKTRNYTWLIAALILVVLAAAAVAFKLGMGSGAPVDTVAFVIADFGNNNYQTGSGPIVSPDGYIITNYHVLHNKAGQPAAQVAVRLNSGTPQSKVIKAEVVAEGSMPTNSESIANDWALLKIKSDSPLPYLKIGASKPPNIKSGDKLIAMGFPKVTVDAGDKTGPTCDVAPGSVTSFLPNDNKPFCIVHSCNTQEGSSGGPLINANNELVGIHRGLDTDENHSEKRLAIPIHMLEKKVLDPYKIDHPK
jgi:S1-C subfamily serine protease